MRSTVDEIVEEAAFDLLQLSQTWHIGGDAALEAAVRADTGLTYAVRRSGAGTALFAMRASSPHTEISVTQTFPERASSAFAVHVRGGTRRPANFVFGFALQPGQPRTIFVRSDTGLTLVAAANLDGARIAPIDEVLTEDFAGRLGIGIDRHVELPAWIEPWTVMDEIGLLNVVDAAARLLAGELGVAPAMMAIAQERCTCGLGETDDDIRSAYAIDSCIISPEQYAWNQERASGAWTWSDELRNSEAFYTEQARQVCRSLIGRFREPSFA